ncbi:CDP-diacylglycerol--glycerol-3-phosphate 3-phosphatidyltransferase, mitochondrial [Strongylocentrotus purpuratus]|uniref:CDP-diacylglycerol--glycerol-3-phosphate 3-phosphatidyltransferase n=1 Tax=Strongylocentrotus purpuratus TaxID=7668 RepID=A0A7M7SY75_STRPU|nr:CDP-diacylglycerol--glycerol-3-phosphate 3-phosphatidyltransferase, mitochondrial [Strongylocentrotus purpuratus]
MHCLFIKQMRGLVKVRHSLAKKHFVIGVAYSSFKMRPTRPSAADGTERLPFQWLKLRAPEFRVSGEQITVLQEPSEFYNAIKDNIGLSKKSIVLASLYLGDGPMEEELVKSIHDACERAESEGEELSIHVLLDCVRGSRGVKNSRTMLQPLLKDFRDQVTVSLYHTPELRGAKKALIPERFNEAIGLSHLKVYTFDDTLLMSGANLSEMYFTNRQDRYILIKNCPELVNFFNELVLAVSSLSFQLHPDNSLTLHSADSIHPFEGDLEEFKLRAFNKIQNVLESHEHDHSLGSLKKWQRTVTGSSKSDCAMNNQRECRTDQSKLGHATTDHKTVQSSLGSVLVAQESGGVHYVFDASANERTSKCNEGDVTDGSVESQGDGCHGDLRQGRTDHNSVEETVDQVKVQLQDEDAIHVRGQDAHPFVGNSRQRTLDDTKATASQGTKSLEDCTKDIKEADTVIYPLVQMGPLGITVDQEVTRQLLGEGDPEAVCYLASGYFNLTSEYMDTILQSNATFEMLMASPQVNGFYGSRGISGYIPHSYTFIAREFFRAIHQGRQQRRITLYEFYRVAWTFHVKGLWYYLPEESLPSLTLIGSPNFGHRSVHRDLEAQLAIVTQNASLREQLHNEHERLYARSEKVTADTFTQPERRVPLWTRLVTIVTRNFF